MWIFVAMAILIIAIIGMLIALRSELQREGVIGKHVVGNKPTVTGQGPSWRLYNDDPTYR